MEAKVTSTRKLEVYPSKHNKEIETAETIFIEDILKLKNEGDSILLTRRNASGLSCLAYLESRPVEKLGYSEGVSQPGDGADIEFYKKALERIANEIGIFSPLQMMARAENDNETYVDILIKILKEKLAPASL